MLFAMGFSRGQALLFETFGDGIPAEWTLLGDGNAPYHAAFSDSWVLYQTYGNPAPCAVSTSWFQQPADADRWMITAPVAIPATGYTLAFDASAYESVYADGFEVRISTLGGDSREQFDTAVLCVVRANDQFCEYTLPLDDYAGQTIWVAFVQNSYDRNFIMIDNVRLCRMEEEEIEMSQIVVPEDLAQGQPFTVEGIVTNRSQATVTGFSYRLLLNGDSLSSGLVTGLSLGHGERCTISDTTLLRIDDSTGFITFVIAPLSGESPDFEGNNSLTLPVYFGQRPHDPIGIETLERPQPLLRLYPNPTHDVVRIQMSDSSIQDVQIINLQGKVVLRETLHSQSQMLNIQGLPAGIYLVRCGHQIQKLIKQ